MNKDKNLSRFNHRKIQDEYLYKIGLMYFDYFFVFRTICIAQMLKGLMYPMAL